MRREISLHSIIRHWTIVSFFYPFDREGLVR
jgi:hypothetical protein